MRNGDARVGAKKIGPDVSQWVETSAVPSEADQKNAEEPSRPEETGCFIKQRMGNATRYEDEEALKPGLILFSKWRCREERSAGIADIMRWWWARLGAATP